MDLSSASGDEKIGAADRTRYSGEAVDSARKVAQAVSGGETQAGEQAVWEAYAGTEKLIAVLRFRLDYETPGAFVELPDSGDRRANLEKAESILLESARLIKAGRISDSIPELRKARNILRAYLISSRKNSLRAGVRARKPSRA